MKKNRYKVAYIISHGHTARGAFQTNLLRKLHDSGIDVIVIAKPNTDHLLQEEIENQKGHFVTYSSKESAVLNQLAIFRTFVHQDIRKNPALLEKHQRRIKKGNATIKRRMINIFYFYMGSIVRNIKPIKNFYLFLERRLYRSKQAEELLSRHQPDAIISTRPIDTMEIKLLNAASRLAITRIMYILSWDNITSKGVFPELADFYLTWGKIMNEELISYYGVKPDQLFLTGVTHFDIHAKVRNKSNGINQAVESLNLNVKKPYLFFSMSSSYYAPNEIDIVEWLAMKIEQNTFGLDMQLVIRPHMINMMADRSNVSWIKRLKSLQSDRVAIDFPNADNTLLTWYMKKDDMYKLSNLINGASICLNSGSTVAIEALFFDKPVVITLFDTEKWPYWLSVQRIKDYLHLKKFFSYNAVDVVNSLEELENGIILNLNDKKRREKNRKEVLLSECYKTDGKSSIRFVENMNQILQQLSE